MQQCRCSPPVNCTNSCDALGSNLLIEHPRIFALRWTNEVACSVYYFPFAFIFQSDSYRNKQQTWPGSVVRDDLRDDLGICPRGHLALPVECSILGRRSFSVERFLWVFVLGFSRPIWMAHFGEFEYPLGYVGYGTTRAVRCGKISQPFGLNAELIKCLRVLHDADTNPSGPYRILSFY